MEAVVRMEPASCLRKRRERTVCSDLASMAPKRQEVSSQSDCLLQGPRSGESMASFFSRFRASVDASLFRFTSGFDDDGLYLYKRPVRSDGGATAPLLAMCGSVFHHCVLYLKQGRELVAMELGPHNAMDITVNIQEAVPPGPILLRPAPAPEPGCLPMLHVSLPARPLGHPAVAAALEHCQRSEKYHALANNCIAFADFMAHVLTGGSISGLPLIFDALAGSFPPADPPLLPLMTFMVGLPSWWHALIGSRLLARFAAAYPPLCGGGGGATAAPAEPAIPPAVPAAAAASSDGASSGSEAEAQTAVGVGAAAEAAEAAVAAVEPALPADSCRSADTTASGGAAAELGSADTSGRGGQRRSHRLAPGSVPRGLSALPPLPRRRLSRSASSSATRSDEEGSC